MNALKGSERAGEPEETHKKRGRGCQKGEVRRVREKVGEVRRFKRGQKEECVCLCVRGGYS